MIRDRPIRGESHVDSLGESEGSLPPPQDSYLDASEAINDFWSMSGNFLYRPRVEPRVKLYSPREESFPIPLKYIDVSRTTHTNLDGQVDSPRHVQDRRRRAREGPELACVQETPLVHGWHTQGRKDELTSCRGTVQSAWQYLQ